MGLSSSLSTLGSQWDRRSQRTLTLDLRCPQLHSAPPGTACLPWARSYLSFWIWQSFTLSMLPSSSITLSLN